jgi:hypothetical protein
VKCGACAVETAAWLHAVKQMAGVSLFPDPSGALQLFNSAMVRMLAMAGTHSTEEGVVEMGKAVSLVSYGGIRRQHAA